MLSASFISSVSTNTVREAVGWVVIRNNVRAIGQECLLLELKLIWVVGASSPLALDISLLHYLILVGDSELLVCCICCCDDDLAATRVATHSCLSGALLAANPD